MLLKIYLEEIAGTICKNMKVAFNCFIPVLQDPVDDNLNTNAGKICTSIISNGYYGYQPIINRPGTQDNLERMDIQNQYNDIQFNNMIEVETVENNAKQNIRKNTNRKRVWEYDGEQCEKKKRRENEPNCIIPTNNLSPKYVKSPTHNIPDMPRCIMGHYI